MGKKQRRQPRQEQRNKNGIPINKHVSLELLRVMGTEDPFEGRRYDPQFEVVWDERFPRPGSASHA